MQNVEFRFYTPPWEFGITVKKFAQKFRTDFKNLQAKSSGKNQKRPDFTRGLFFQRPKRPRPRPGPWNFETPFCV